MTKREHTEPGEQELAPCRCPSSIFVKESDHREFRQSDGERSTGKRMRRSRRTFGKSTGREKRLCSPSKNASRCIIHRGSVSTVFIGSTTTPNTSIAFFSGENNLSSLTNGESERCVDEQEAPRTQQFNKYDQARKTEAERLN